ncbi:MAG: Co2+/Mg2+ efflux protein ApaG [Myxococcota bacterium]
MGTCEHTTEGITIRVESQYVPERSAPARNAHFFIYAVEIINEGDRPAQLISRHWIITDGEGHVEEVRGPGVVGEMPRLAPGERFSYTSACPLPTPVGSMRGTYRMVRDDGESFDAHIAPFTLSMPYAIN